MTPTKPKRQRKETRVGKYWQKPQRITRDEAIAAQRDRGIYENAKAIVEAARTNGVGIKFPTKRGDL